MRKFAKFCASIALITPANIAFSTEGAAARRSATDPVPVDLRRAANDYDRAQQQGDRRELSRLLADEYLLVNSGGVLETRAEFIAESTDPNFKLDPFKVEDGVVRVSSDQAILGGVATLSGSDHARHFAARLRFVDVWQKRRGRWQVVYTQVTKAAGPAS